MTGQEAIAGPKHLYTQILDLSHKQHEFDAFYWLPGTPLLVERTQSLDADIRGILVMRAPETFQRLNQYHRS